MYNNSKRILFKVNNIPFNLIFVSMLYIILLLLRI